MKVLQEEHLRTWRSAQPVSSWRNDRFNQQYVSKKKTPFGVQKLLDAIHDSVLIVDESLSIVQMNKTARKLLGGTYIGRKCFEVVYGTKLCPQHCVSLKAFDTEDCISVEKTIPQFDEKIFRISAEQIDSENSFVMCTLKDITEEKKEEIKDVFLSRVSHELKTPLNGIYGMAQLLLMDGELSKEQRDFLEIINRSSQRLASSINDILDFSKERSKENEILKQRINPKELLEKIRQYYAIMFDAINLEKKKNIQFSIEIGDDIPEEFYSDSDKILQVLVGLMKNAIKFTSEGSIKLSLNYLKKTNSLIFSVEDTGIGIDEKFHSKIFGDFMQVEDYMTRCFDGLGIGLSTTKFLVESLGGNIWIEFSEIGKGTNFTFTIKNLGK